MLIWCLRVCGKLAARLLKHAESRLRTVCGMLAPSPHQPWQATYPVPSATGRGQRPALRCEAARSRKPRAAGACLSRSHRQSVMGGEQGHTAGSQMLQHPVPAQTEVAAGHRAKARRLQQTETPSRVRRSPGSRGAACNTALGQKSDSLKEENRKQPNPGIFPFGEHSALPLGKFTAVFKSQQ